MSLVVLKQGLLDTFQDTGRTGYRTLGINPGGAMDTLSLQLANALVGNDPGEAALELHFPAGTFLFTKPALVALTGADFSPLINGEPVPLHHPILVEKNDLLQFQRPVNGLRAYLAVRGGWAINPWLGSRSTHLRAGCGGWQGRKLQEKDELPFRDPEATAQWPSRQKSFRVLPWEARIPVPHTAIQLLPGPEWPWLSEDARELLLSENFTVTLQADRMACRLQHPPLTMEKPREMISAAVAPGTLQLLPDGHLLVLLSDCQTTGGYPRVAQVISADLHRLGQAKPGDRIRWELTGLEEAEKKQAAQSDALRQLYTACRWRLETVMKTNING